MGRPPGKRGAGRPRGGGRAPGRPAGRPAGRPPGRPRRDSNSTVASVDLSHVTYRPELDILKPAKTQDTDNWTCFVLDEAVVYRRAEDGELQIANVCIPDLEGPFVIRGKLDVDMSEQDQRSCLRNHGLKSSYIEISGSIMYAIGDGPTSIWASGQAGWFEINPSREYGPMYETVCEGINLYYSVLCAYEDAGEKAPKAKRAQSRQLSVETLLFKYALRMGDGVTLPEAKERCRKHAPFLLGHFSKAQDFVWSGTSFMKWMISENEDWVKKLAEAARKKLLEPPAQQQQRCSPDSMAIKREPETISPVESARSQRSRSRASRQSQEADVEMKDASATPMAPVPSRVETPIHPPLPARMPSATTAVPSVPAPSVPAPSVPAPQSAKSTIMEKADDSPDQPQDPLQTLIDLLEEIFAEAGGDASKVKASTVSSRLYIKCSMGYGMARDVISFYAKQLAASLPSKWYSSPFFQWLKEERTKPWQPEFLTAETVPFRLVRRKKSNRAGVPRAQTLQAASTPSPSAAGKHYPGTPRPSGLRPYNSAKRPMLFDDGDDEDEDGRPHKLSKIIHISDDEDDEDDEDEVIDISDMDTDIPHGATATFPAGSKETMKIVVRAERIPSMSPSGPNGTWKCDEDGCSYIVRSAEEAEGKELIAKHFQDHENRAEKVNLALAEGTRGHLPINHLLDKIRSFGESSKGGEQTQPESIKFPESIKRRLMV